MEIKVSFWHYLLAHPCSEFQKSFGGAHGFSLRTKQRLHSPLLLNFNLRIIYLLGDSQEKKVKQEKEKVAQVWKEGREGKKRKRERKRKKQQREEEVRGEGKI